MKHYQNKRTNCATTIAATTTTITTTNYTTNIQQQQFEYAFGMCVYVLARQQVGFLERRKRITPMSR